MKIQILGTGCPKCNQLAENVALAIKESALNAEIEKITSISEIMKFKIMITPALAVDGVVKSKGKVLSVQEIKDIIEKQ